MKELVIGNNEAGKRFDKLLIKYLDKAPSSFIYKMLRKKNITLNGKKAAGNEILSTGDIVKIFLADDTFDKFSSSTAVKPVVDPHNNLLKKHVDELDIIYEDDHFILMNKPYGMLSQKATPSDISINEVMLGYLLKTGVVTEESLKTFKPSICNRLDRNTSGLIIGGKSLLALQTGAKILKNRSSDKYYLAFVAGKLQNSQLIKGYLTKDVSSNTVSISQAGTDGDYIETKYEPIAIYENMTLLRVKLITGKPHQIRAHLAFINHPIIGDPKYGDLSINKLFFDKFGVRHQLLHSFEFVFPDFDGALNHLSGRSFTAKPPKAFDIMIKGNTPVERKELADGYMELQGLKR